MLARALEGSTGLLTITGPSGVGKTRLLRQLLGEIDDATRGCLIYAELGGCRRRAEIEGEVARRLGAPDLSGEALVEAVESRGRLLLALDDASAGAAAVKELVEGWLDRCGELQLIATSLLPLGVEGEIRFELGPLEPADAVELYRERAHRAWAGRTFTEAETADVEELVQRLDRIPKAIELAAARVRVLPPRTLLSRFDERFELLGLERDEGGAPRDPLDRSWALLSERERSILMGASVFEGSFRYEAAIAILADPGSEAAMLDQLDGLRSKGLLRIEERGLPRFRLLGGVRAVPASIAARSSVVWTMLEPSRMVSFLPPTVFQLRLVLAPKAICGSAAVKLSIARSARTSKESQRRLAPEGEQKT